MEKTKITIKTKNEIKTDYTGIIDHSENKLIQKQIWNWATHNKIQYVEDIIGGDMNLRHWLIEDETVKSALKQITTKWKFTNNTWKIVGKLRPKCWVKYTRSNGNINEGVIIATTKDDVQVRIKTGRKTNQISNVIKWWPKKKCKELKLKETLTPPLKK